MVASNKHHDVLRILTIQVNLKNTFNSAFIRIAFLKIYVSTRRCRRDALDDLGLPSEFCACCVAGNWADEDC
ncbi:unnamed protein product [Mesocestoides corti]|uniref:Uncharacterized protein n=1 Tax=Mesocestoides corti TaxID=53468 RepID=A0A0R3UBB6_MESCO|nr:unnamed protein product [Mesocestoides corti]